MSSLSPQPVDSAVAASQIRPISEASLEKLNEAKEKIQPLMAQALFDQREEAKGQLLDLACIPLTEEFPQETALRACPFRNKEKYGNEELMARHRKEQMWDDRILPRKEGHSLAYEALVDPKISQALPARIGRSPGLKEELNHSP